MGLAEGMPARNQRNCFLVVHRHAAERLTDVPRRSDWIGLSVRPFRIHVDQAHLDRAKRIRQLTIAAVAVVIQPLAFRSPEKLLRFPYVLAPAAETESLEAHRFQRDVSGENHEVSPRDFPAILLLDRPE